MYQLKHRWLLAVLCLWVVSCGSDDFADNIADIEISTLLLPRRITAGTREFLGAILYNHAGVALDGLSAFEAYEDIKWKSSDKSIAEVETFADDKSAALVTFKKRGKVTITASFKDITDSVLLEVE